MPIGPWELAIILFVLGGPILLGILFVIFLVTRARSPDQAPPGSRSAIEILEQRYARGEIDTEEFEGRRQRILRDSS
jgi:putative membrane protein